MVTGVLLCGWGRRDQQSLGAGRGLRAGSHRTELPLGTRDDDRGSQPGSGFDVTIRSVVDALEREKIVNVPLPVQNRPGDVGALFLATMVEQYKGADDEVSVTSLSMMMNQLRGTSKYGYDDVTMIARLMTEHYVVITRPGSPFRALDDVMTAIKSDPGGVAVGAATDDEAPFDLLVSAAVGDPSTINYVSLEGGADQSAALLNGDIGVAIAGVSEVIGLLNEGNLDALGVLSEQRLPGLDAPTAREQGLDVTLSNWRGLYGLPACRTSLLRTGRRRLARWSRRRPGSRSRSATSSPPRSWSVTSSRPSWRRPKRT